MLMTTGPTATRDDKFFPPVGAPEAEILKFRDRVINRWSIYRNRHMARVALSIWYYIGRQWSELDIDAAYDGVRGAILRDMDIGNEIRPITNEVDPAVEQEVIALVKGEWIPKCVATSNDPRIKAAAQVSQDSINYRLEQQSWSEKRHQLGLYYATTGTGLIYTNHDRTYFELKTIGAPTAVWCDPNAGGCGTKLYSAEVPVDTLRAGIEGQPVSHADSVKELLPEPGESTIERVELQHCPTCQDAMPLSSYEVTPEDALEGDDVFGRPLGIQVPRGSSTLEIDLPGEFFPPDGGVHVTPDTMRRFGRRKIRSMEWIEERAPHLIDEIEQDSINDLLYSDPILGEWAVLGQWSPHDVGILDNHANIDELVEQPTFRNPKGRYVMCTQNKVIEDAVLLESATLVNAKGKSEEVFVARAQEAAARWKIRPGEFWGTSLPDHIISPQNRLNGLDAQMVEARLRAGPYIMMDPGAWFAEGPVRDVQGVGNFIFYQAPPDNPEARPEHFLGPMMPETVMLERDRVQKDIPRLVGPSEASRGVNPTGVGNTSQLELLIEQDEKSKALREEALVKAAEKAWSHIQDMQWVLHADDEDTYRSMGPDGAWKYEQYKGNALRGQTEIKLERQPFIKKSVVSREAAREALADQLVVLDGPVARKKMLEEYGIRTDINEDSNRQIDHANKTWVEFLEKNRVPVQDTLDDPMIFYQVLGTYLKTEEGQELGAAAGWEDTVRKTAGWQDELRVLVSTELMSMAEYGGRRFTTEGEASEAFAQKTMMRDQIVQLNQQQVQTNTDIQAESDAAIAAGMQPTVMPQPLQPVPPPPNPPVHSIPVLLQDRILFVWQSMLSKVAGMQQGPPAPPPDATAPLDEARLQVANQQEKTDAYVKFRAYLEAFHLTIVGVPGMEMAGAMGGAPPLGSTPSPGSGATGAPVDKGSVAMPTQGNGTAAPPQAPATGSAPEGGAN